MAKSEARSLHVGVPGRPAVAPKRTLIVGVTGDGYVPVVEDALVEDAGAWGRSVIRLPSVLLDTNGRRRMDPRKQALSQLRRSFGYDADELLPMETKGPPGFLLAPLLRNAGWRWGTGDAPGVYEVPLRRVDEWLWHRCLAGAIESPTLRRGLCLAREFFPRWARVRLCRAIGEIESRRSEGRLA